MTSENITIHLPFGINIIPCKWLSARHVTYQYRFPKSRKKRIRKKWSKNKLNFKTKIVDDVYMFNNKTIFMSESNYHKLIIES